MSNTKSSRRSFIKTAAAGAAGLALSSRAFSYESCVSGNVLVTFEGAMVFHPLSASNEYEVGLLIPRIAPHHVFGITKGSAPISAGRIPTARISPIELRIAMSIGNAWNLEVINIGSGEARIVGLDRPQQVGHHDRLDETGTNTCDFSWIADFESTEWHGTGTSELCLTPALLKPIIRLSQGELFSLYKIEKLKRKKNSNPSPPGEFGFMTETVGLNIRLTPNERLRLRVANHVVLNVDYEAGKKALVEIQNFPPKKERHGSHFQVYYGLFPCIGYEDQYQIELDCPRILPQKKPGRLPRKSLGKPQTCKPVFPINRHPDISDRLDKMVTIADYPCGPIKLGVRGRNLE